MEQWLSNPVLLKPDLNAKYAEVIEIDLNEIKEPLLACPNAVSYTHLTLPTILLV